VPGFFAPLRLESPLSSVINKGEKGNLVMTPRTTDTALVVRLEEGSFVETAR
jgi:hypothetical protein